MTMQSLVIQQTCLSDELLTALKKDGHCRDNENLTEIFCYLRGIKCLETMSDSILWSYSETCLCQFHDASSIIYRRGDAVECWYLLISGSILTESVMFTPISRFGHEMTSHLRNSDCLVLDPSYILVFPDIQYHNDEVKDNQQCRQVSSTDVCANYELKDERPPSLTLDLPESDGETEDTYIEPCSFPDIQYHNDEVKDNQQCRQVSSTDVCANYELKDERPPSLTLDLPESDGETEDTYIEPCSMSMDREHDQVRDILSRDPAERTEDDIEVLLEFLQNIKAFSNMTVATRRSMCEKMRLAIVAAADTIVLNDGEELDSWSAIIDGQVEVVNPDGTVVQLDVGDSFGIRPTMEKLHHCGIMHTKVPNCKFVCIMQSDYYDILHQGFENISRVEEKGKTVLVTEKRTAHRGGRSGIVVIRGVPDKLMSHLVEDSSVDPTYAEDFLLTYRTFISSPLNITARLLDWFERPATRDKVIRVILLWANSRYRDFESNPHMLDFLDKIAAGLHAEHKEGELELLDIIRTTGSHSRTLTLVRQSRSAESWGFTLLERRPGVTESAALFVRSVEKGSKAEQLGLRSGDQFLQINGHCCDYGSDERIQSILSNATRLEIVAKCNLVEFHAAKREHKTKRCSGESQDGGGVKGKYIATSSSSGLIHLRNPDACSGDRKDIGVLNSTQIARRKLFKVLAEPLHKLNLLSSNNNAIDFGVSESTGEAGKRPVLRSSSSDPDLSSSLRTSWGSSSYRGQVKDCNDNPADQVLKIYRADHSFRYFLVHKEMTAGEVVNQTLKEFGMHDAARHDAARHDAASFYSLWEVSFDDSGALKQVHISDQQTNIAERWMANSRLYVRISSLSDDPFLFGVEATGVADEMRRECSASLLQLGADVVADQLMTRDLRLFGAIQSSEFIDSVFQLPGGSTENLDRFTQLTNNELFWVIAEVCKESNVLNRAKLVQQFIKIAKYCKECNNFNSMFAIIGGLSHRSVSRLKLTWDKVQSKYTKLFKNLQELMNPSGNMLNYRNLLNSQLVQGATILPFFPVVMKDLTFFHYGNDSVVEGLVNFEKLRMMSKEIRHITDMATSHRHTRLGSDRSPSWANSSLSSSGFATLRKKKTGLYEEAMMVRRAKFYLSNLSVIQDEMILAQMSNKCEPRDTANGVTRKRDASPMPQSVSSLPEASAAVENKQLQNIAAPKFGTESPQAMRKLMALSERVKPHDQRKNPVPPASSGSNISLVETLLPPSTSTAAGAGKRTTQLQQLAQPSSKHKATAASISLSVESSSVSGHTVGAGGSFASKFGGKSVDIRPPDNGILFDGRSPRPAVKAPTIKVGGLRTRLAEAGQIYERLADNDCTSSSASSVFVETSLGHRPMNANSCKAPVRGHANLSEDKIVIVRRNEYTDVDCRLSTVQPRAAWCRSSSSSTSSTASGRSQEDSGSQSTATSMNGPSDALLRHGRDLSASLPDGRPVTNRISAPAAASFQQPLPDYYSATIRQNHLTVPNADFKAASIFHTRAHSCDSSHRRALPASGVVQKNVLGDLDDDDDYVISAV